MKPIINIIGIIFSCLYFNKTANVCNAITGIVCVRKPAQMLVASYLRGVLKSRNRLVFHAPQYAMMKQRFIKVFVCLCIGLGLAITSFSQSKYYVSTSGSDANSGTSLAAPFATIAKAISVAITPGDSIFVRSGTYTVTATVKISKPGTAAKHIVLTVYKPDMVNANSRPVFDFSSMAVSSGNRGFTLSNANYWDIYGIVIKGAGDNGMNISGTSYTTITFCSFTRNRDTGLQIGGGSNHLTITNCDSYENADLGTGTTTLGGNADGFAPKLDVGDTVIFRGCRAWMNSDDGWDGYMRITSGADTITTFLEDCWTFRNGYYWLDGSTTSSENGNGFKMGGSDTKNLAHNFVLIKCLSFMNKANGYDQNSNAGSMYLYNCSAYKNLGSNFYLTSPNVTYVAGAQLVLINNLSLGPTGVSVPSSGTSSRALTSQTNSFSTASTNADILSYDTTGVTGMRSVDGSLPVLNFMKLNPSAPSPHTYIDKGTVLSDVVYHGVKGVPYEGAAPDLGAFELSTNNAPLPVKLLSFSAYGNLNNVTLDWKITSANNNGWSIERSFTANNSSWTEVGFVNGVNSSEVNNYSFTDKNVLPSTYYYRLKQIGADGSVVYSNVLMVKIENEKQQASLQAFPNPFGAAATVAYVVPSSSIVSLRLYDVQGKLVSAINEGVQQAGTYQKLINTSSLLPGQYFLQVAIGEQTLTSSLIKQ